MRTTDNREDCRREEHQKWWEEKGKKKGVSSSKKRSPQDETFGLIDWKTQRLHKNMGALSIGRKPKGTHWITAIGKRKIVI